MAIQVNPVRQAPAPQAAPAPTPAVAVAGNPTLPPGVTATTSSNDGQAITMPTVAAAPFPTVVGFDGVDRGDAAEYEVVHHLVGQFKQRDRLTADDLGGEASIERLLRLGAVRSLKDAPAADAPATDAPADPAPQGPPSRRGK